MSKKKKNKAKFTANSWPQWSLERRKGWPPTKRGEGFTTSCRSKLIGSCRSKLIGEGSGVGDSSGIVSYVPGLQ